MPETQELRVNVYIPRVRTKDVVKATIVVMATVAVVDAAVHAINPKLRKLLDEIKTENAKWKNEK